MRTFVPLILAACVLAPTAASAQTSETRAISLGGSLDSKYVFSDLYVQIDEPTAKVWANIDTRRIGIKGCSIDLFLAHGVATDKHYEGDIGASCRFDLNKDVKVELSASRYMLAGLSDITTLEGKVSHGPIDLRVTEYLVADGEPDATKVEFGYTVEPVKKLTIRGVLTFEHGFGLHDIYVGGAEANYALTEHLSLTLSGYAPLHKIDDDPRKAQVTAGITVHF